MKKMNNVSFSGLVVFKKKIQSYSKKADIIYFVIRERKTFSWQEPNYIPTIFYYGGNKRASALREVDEIAPGCVVNIKGRIRSLRIKMPTGQGYTLKDTVFLVASQMEKVYVLEDEAMFNIEEHFIDIQPDELFASLDAEEMEEAEKYIEEKLKEVRSKKSGR
jgi:hypothetical protein